MPTHFHSSGSCQMFFPSFYASSPLMADDEDDHTCPPFLPSHPLPHQSFLPVPSPHLLPPSHPHNIELPGVCCSHCSAVHQQGWAFSNPGFVFEHMISRITLPPPSHVPSSSSHPPLSSPLPASSFLACRLPCWSKLRRKARRQSSRALR